MHEKLTSMNVKRATLRPLLGRAVQANQYLFERCGASCAASRSNPRGSPVMVSWSVLLGALPPQLLRGSGRFSGRFFVFESHLAKIQSRAVCPSFQLNCHVSLKSEGMWPLLWTRTVVAEGNCLR